MSHIDFFEGRNCTQDHLGLIRGDQPCMLNLKNYHGLKNDEIKSARFHLVPAGSVLKIYDNPNGHTNDDWTEIRILKTRPSIQANTLEQDVSSTWMEQKYHRHNGLDGKVSRLVFTPGAVDSLEYKFACGLYEEFSHWPKKGGDAFELSSQGSNYRLWRPDMSPTAEHGLLVSMKMDHIRGGLQDDHARVLFSLDEHGLLIESEWEIQLAGENPIAKVLKAAGDTIATINDPTARLIASAAKLGAEIVIAVEKLTDNGGRVNFPSVIQHTINRMATAL